MQLVAVSRLQKILARVDGCQGPEQGNARFLLQRELERVNWSEVGLRSLQASRNPDGEAAMHKAEVEVRFASKLTKRRAWLESLADRVCDVMGLACGLNKETGDFGRTGHNGVALIGPLGAALSGAALLCKIAEAAMVTDKCDQDAWANAFCCEVFPAIKQSSEAASSQERSQKWLEDKDLFKIALELHGKEYDVFQRIRQMFPVKSMTDLVKFYYCHHHYDYSRDRGRK